MTLNRKNEVSQKIMQKQCNLNFGPEQSTFKKRNQVTQQRTKNEKGKSAETDLEQFNRKQKKRPEKKRNYLISLQCNFVTFQMKTKEAREKKKSTSLRKKNSIQLSIFILFYER